MSEVRLEGSAVREIAGLASDAAKVDITKVVGQVGEHEMSTVLVYHIPQKPFEVVAEPQSLTFFSLSALVEYMESQRDGLTRDKLMVLVEGPAQVRIAGPLTGEAMQRLTYARAVAADLTTNFLDRDQSQLQFSIGLQTRFVESETTKNLLKLISSLKQESVIEDTDDGRSQKVSTRAGVHLQGPLVEVPNPVRLAPYRTFREVEQPESAMILRVDRGQAGPVLKLIQADGGAWQLEAVADVAAWLREQLSERSIDVPVLA